MPETLEDREFRGPVERLEALLHEAERFPDAARVHIRAVVEAVLDLHCAGLEKMLATIADSPASGNELIDELAGDALVSDLLVLHGLHPLDLEARVRQALDVARPQLRGSVELVSVRDGVVRLHVGDESNRQVVENAILTAASDVAGIEFWTTTFVPLEDVLPRNVARRVPQTPQPAMT